MNYRYIVWYFLALFMACAVSLHDNGLMVIMGMALFFWSLMVGYYRHSPR